MASYIVIRANIKDKQKYQQYGANVPETLVKYEGEVLVKGAIDQLKGESEFSMQLILVFPNKEKAYDWYNSSEYQALAAIRDESIDSQFIMMK